VKSIAVPLLVLALLATSRAQLFPERPEGTYIADMANLIKPEDRTQITQAAQDLLQQTGAPIVVATVPSLATVKADDIGIEAYAHKMFDTWRIGKSSANHGILLVVAKDDHKARIELGGDWGNRYDNDSHQIMTSDILPAFKRGDYSGGIVKGVQALKQMTLTAAAVSSGGQEESSDIPWFWIFLGGGILVLVGVRQAMQRAGSGGFSGFGQSSNTAWPNYSSPTVTNDYIAPTVIVVDNTVYNNDSYDNSSYDSSSSDSGGGFDSGSSGGGGDSGSW